MFNFRCANDMSAARVAWARKLTMFDLIVGALTHTVTALAFGCLITGLPWLKNQPF